MNINKEFLWDVKGDNIYLTRITKLSNRQVEGTPFIGIKSPTQEHSTVTFGRIVAVGTTVEEFLPNDIVQFPTAMGLRYTVDGTEYLVIDKKSITAKFKKEFVTEIKDSEIFYN